MATLDHEMTVTEYLEVTKPPNCKVDFAMTMEVQGFDGKKVLIPQCSQGRCAMTFEGDTVVFKMEKKE